MASTFEGLGTGMLGTDRSYVNHNNPLSSALSGLKDFGIMYGMDKAGVFDYLNKMGEQKQTMMDKYPGLSTKKPDGSAAPPVVSAPVSGVTGAAPPAAADTSTSVDAIQNVPISDEAADNLFKNTSGAQPGTVTNKVLPASTFVPGAAAQPVDGAQISGVSPNAMQPRNMGQDQLAMDVASAPPSQMNLKQYGQPGSSGIGSKVATAFVTKLLTSLI